MRIVFFGSSEFAIPTFRSILDDGHEIVLTVTQPDRPRGRGREPLPTSVKTEALSRGIPVLTPENVNAPDIVDQLKSADAALGYVAAFGQKFGDAILTAFPTGMINLHGSLLPALRGAAPVQWAVIQGLGETGVTVFRIVQKMDAGPILTQRRTEIGADETADELRERLARIGCDAVSAALMRLASEPAWPGTVQDASRVTIAPKLEKADGRISFDVPVRDLSNRICGLWSWPGAVCQFVSADGMRVEPVTIARAIPYEGRTSPAATPDLVGRITEMMSVQTSDSELSILEIKPANGRLMPWPDFVNGRHVRSGDRFLPLADEPK